MAAPAPAAAAAEQLGVMAYYNGCVPLQLCQEKIIVDITGPSSARRKTARLDLVLVLDTSESMEGKKLQQMKQAVDFVIRKIGEKDTLTIVSCSDKANTLLQTSGDDKKPARKFVEGLTARGKSNIKEGLHTAVRILGVREHKTGHAAGVFLISSGQHDVPDAKDDHDAPHFPVFTFGVGQHNHKLLYKIARRSYGGTYHNVQYLDLISPVAKVLAILRDISALNLMVTLKPHAGATIMELKHGYYVEKYDQDGGFRTIKYGDLARKEHRKMLVVLVFPPVHKDERAKNVMTVKCSYGLPGEKERIITKTLDIEIARNKEPGPHSPIEHFQVELARRKQFEHIHYMKILADGKKFDEANNVLQQATEDLNTKRKEYTINTQLQALELELDQLKHRLKSQKDYEEFRSEAYMLAAILSHFCQRFAARGSCTEDVRLYVMTKRMLKYESHVKLFLKNADTAKI